MILVSNFLRLDWDPVLTCAALMVSRIRAQAEIRARRAALPHRGYTRVRCFIPGAVEESSERFFPPVCKCYPECKLLFDVD
jgi:hypothetical protein